MTKTNKHNTDNALQEQKKEHQAVTGDCCQLMGSSTYVSNAYIENISSRNISAEIVTEQQQNSNRQSDKLPESENLSDLRGVGINKGSDFYSCRVLYNLSKNYAQARKLNLCGRLFVNLPTSAIVLGLQYRFQSQGGSLGAGGGPMNDTYDVLSLIKEIPVWKVIG